METLSPEKSGVPGLHTVAAGSGLFDVLGNILEHAAAFPEAHSIWDLGGIDISGVGSASIDRFVHGLPRVSRDAAGPRIAFVAPSDAGFGIMRMFEIMADGKLPFRMMVFRSVEEAEEWARYGGI